VNHLTRGRVVKVLLAGGAICAGSLLLALLLDVRTTADGRQLTILSFWSEGSTDRFAFFQLRLPRVLGAAVIGAGLATAGCAFQAALRNPLAEPFTLGISSGSSLFAVLAIRLGLEQWLGQGGVGIAALVGAGITVLLVWRLANVGGTLPAATLLLAGITIAMFCGAATMLIQYTASFSDVYRMVRWMMGGLDDIRTMPLLWTGMGTLFGIGVLQFQARSLNALSTGRDSASSLGVSADRVTAITLGTASLVVGASIALAGPIGFVGLMVPHAMRALVGPDHRILLPASALGGATMLVLCDAIARDALSYGQLPVGVVTALLGGPFFLRILAREKTRGGLWGG